jgi:predicted Zn-dependent protease
VRRSRLVIAFVIVIMAVIGYYGSKQVNPITGETQAIALSPEQEVALGVQSAPEMAEQFGGLDPDPAAQAIVDEVGERIVRSSIAARSPYQFQFHVLADPATVNAFALPGGPIFITRALLGRLENEAQLAGILGHEVGHVIGRHAAERLAKDQLAQGLIGAIAVGAADEYGDGRAAAQLAAMVANVVQMKYGREDEIQSDTLGVRLMGEAGYDPRALIRVMEILEEASGGSERAPEFMSTHPDPGNRRAVIEEAIARRWPGGVPPELSEGRGFVTP